MAKKGSHAYSGARGLVKPPPVERPVLEGTTATAALEDAERDSLRAKARKHTDKSLKTLSGLMNNRKTPASVRRQAANDLLTWGYGRPAVSAERGQADDGGITVILQQFHLGDGSGQPRVERDVTPPRPEPEEIEAAAEPSAFEPMEFDVEALAGAER